MSDKGLILLSRDQFRESCLERDKHKCVFCDETENLAVHHIIERRLFSDGGYYTSNGATVCEKHHIECEKTLISVPDVRYACGITKYKLPDHFYYDVNYDKWGNIILPSEWRLRGELFNDESVQKILKEGDVLQYFKQYVKYPRTYHLPWSLGLTDDDRCLNNTNCFENKRVIVTTKFDGENSSLYTDYTHARSVDSRNHASRNWLKGFWSQFCGDIPDGWRICGENMYAKHSIFYDNLETYFYGFSIWNEHNVCLSWDETLEYFECLGITPVTVLYDDIFNEDKIKSLWDKSKWDTMEGYVVRIADSFSYGNFNKSVAKFVRNGHVQTTGHWMHGRRIDPNILSNPSKGF